MKTRFLELEIQAAEILSEIKSSQCTTLDHMVSSADNSEKSIGKTEKNNHLTRSKHPLNIKERETRVTRSSVRSLFSNDLLARQTEKKEDLSSSKKYSLSTPFPKEKCQEKKCLL
jgi:hypothetical protein